MKNAIETDIKDEKNEDSVPEVVPEEDETAAEAEGSDNVVTEETEEDKADNEESGSEDGDDFDENESGDGDDFDENESGDGDDFDDSGDASDEKPDENAESEKKPFPKEKVLKISGIVLGVLAVIYFSGVLFYNYHFFFHTNLGNFDCSNMTPAKAAERIKTDIGDYTFTLIEHEDVMESISGKDISLAYEAMDDLAEIKKQQNPFLWVTDYSCRNLPVDIQVSFDADALYQKVAGLKCVAESNTSMEGATQLVYYDDANNVYSVNDSGADNIVSLNKIFDKSKAAITDLYKNMYLEAEGCYVGMAEEDKMHKALDTLNKYVATKVTYTREANSSYLDGGSIHEWLTLNDDYSVTLDTSAVASWVDDLAALYDTIGSSRTFVTSYGDTVTVSGGDYGWRVDTEKETSELSQLLANGEEISRDPVYSQTAGSHGANNDFPNTYVEVNINAQHVWFYKDGEQIVSTDCVSGNPYNGNQTDTGVYSLKYKERNAVLTGPGYASPVSFWMPFNGGQGLHDAPWRGAFGGSIYRGGGSHGCVNLPYSAAQSIYNSIEQGVPVIVY